MKTKRNISDLTNEEIAIFLTRVELYVPETERIEFGTEEHGLRYANIFTSKGAGDGGYWFGVIFDLEIMILDDIDLDIKTEIMGKWFAYTQEIGIFNDLASDPEDYFAGQKMRRNGYLSKTKYCAGIQCPKILWLNLHKPEQYNNAVLDETALATGRQVGDLAKGYFGDYTEVAYDKNKFNMIKRTEALIKNKTAVIAEASFLYHDDYCSVDLLRRLPNGTYEIVEVKSSTSYKDIYLHDLAYQYYILTGCGIPVKRLSLLHINSSYVRSGELDIQQFFTLMKCTHKVNKKRADIIANLAEIKRVARMEEEPNNYSIGTRCDTPYKCGYKQWCFRHLPENNVFDIGWRMSMKEKEKAYHNGIITFGDVLAHDVKLTAAQRRQVESAINNLDPHIDRDAIGKFLEIVKYPLYHLDFETFQQAVPIWDGIAPYAQIPFQYSLHIQESTLSEPTHKEFLAKEGTDPRREIAQRLCADIPRGACVIAYNMAFEKARIEALANMFPDLQAHLMDIHDSMIDLMIPLRQGAYYDKEMKGSHSIKVVLHTLFPNDPELDYKKLSIIQNGVDAKTMYSTLQEQPLEEASKIRKALLAYCKLDTLAMVRILEKLYGFIDEK